MEAAGVSPAEVNMGLTEILLIVIGIAVFVGSFLLPEKLSKEQAIVIPEEKIKELVQAQVHKATIEIEEKVDETISAAAEKTERYMERLSNEKVMAIQEYSDTVLGQINKNHEEAVFLYDMLNNKYAQVKNATAEIHTKVQKFKDDNEAELSVQPVEEVNYTGASGITSEGGSAPSTIPQEKKEEKVAKPSNKRKVPAKKAISSNEKKEKTNSKIEIQFEPDSNVGNNKEKILALHKEGKSNMAIAKSLGLGIGEVKLIIDLFENGE